MTSLTLLQYYFICRFTLPATHFLQLSEGHFDQVWKKEFSPCEGELAALRRGEEWDDLKKKLEKEERESREKRERRERREQNINPFILTLGWSFFPELTRYWYSLRVGRVRI